jgi:hypothetical protein
MDINDIRAPGGFGPLGDPPAETPVKSKREDSFADAKATILGSDSPKPFGVLTQFSKAALEDPVKLDVMVRACVTELIDSGQSVTGPLSSAGKESVLDFLSGDPLVRRQVEIYLRKVLV